MHVDKITDIAKRSYADTCPFMSKDNDRMCRSVMDCNMDCDYINNFIKTLKRRLNNEILTNIIDDNNIH